jgi:hypothetical protein
LPSTQATRVEALLSPAPVLRPESPPADRLDFEDRHATRATESDDLADRYIKLSKDRRKNDWHHFAMTMIGLVVCMAVFLAGFVVVSRLLPHLSTRQVTQVVAIAFVAGGGGVVVRAAGRELTNRFRSRGRGSKPL